MAEERSLQKPSELPFDIVEEILARLPVKTLLRFQCVCRRWRILFRSKAFVARHMTFAPRKFLLFDGSQSRSIVYHHDSDCEPEMILEEHDLAVGEDLNHLSIVDHSDRRLVLWNPSTRELRTINYKLPSNLGLAGFGYDHTTSDYKIITLRLDPRRTKLECTNWGEIFKLNFDRKMFNSPINFVTTIKDRILLDRHIFWLINDASIEKDLILCFDIVLETFKQIPSPPFVCESDDEAFGQHLLVVRRRLCMVDSHGYKAENKIVIWAADDDDQKRGINGRETWIKWFTIPMASIGIPRSHIISAFLLERCSDFDDKELLIGIEVPRREYDRIISYNVEEDRFTEIETNFPGCGQLEYLETIASTSGF